MAKECWKATTAGWVCDGCLPFQLVIYNHRRLLWCASHFRFLAIVKQLPALLFHRINTASCLCRSVPTAEDFMISDYNHASSIVAGAIYCETIVVDLEVTTTLFTDVPLSFLQLNHLAHPLVAIYSTPYFRFF